MRRPIERIGPLTFCLLFLTAGCQSDAETLSLVRGKVYYKNVLMSGGTIVFTPDPKRGGGGPLAQAEIKPDGTFMLRTGQNLGALVGWHRITLVAVEAPPPSNHPEGFVEPRTLLPARYRDPELSGLAREVKAGQENVFYFYLE